MPGPFYWGEELLLRNVADLFVGLAMAVPWPCRCMLCISFGKAVDDNLPQKCKGYTYPRTFNTVRRHMRCCVPILPFRTLAQTTRGTHGCSAYTTTMSWNYNSNVYSWMTFPRRVP